MGEITEGLHRPLRAGPHDAILSEICAELDRAYSKHGREPWGRHEFYGILKEEVDEAWDEIKKDSPMQTLRKEVIQVAAMCVRFLETGDKNGKAN